MAELHKMLTQPAERYFAFQQNKAYFDSCKT